MTQIVPAPLEQEEAELPHLPDLPDRGQATPLAASHDEHEAPPASQKSVSVKGRGAGKNSGKNKGDGRRLHSTVQQAVVEKVIKDSGSLRVKRKYLIDPRTSQLIGYWDGITAAALVFTAIMAPFEVGFLPPPRSPVDGLFLVNRFVDCIFILDLLLQFRLVYASGEGPEGMRWVDDPSKIAANYLKGWFLLDIVSISVSTFDIVGLSDTADRNTSRLKILRVIRALRLIKLLRLVKASRMFARWETKLAINYSMLKLAQCFFGILFVSHWFACVWGLQASFDPLASWPGDKRYCVDLGSTPQEVEALESRGYTVVTRGTGPEPADTEGDESSQNYQCYPPGTMYAASLYWAVMTVTSIGYGDIAATMGNAIEQVLCTLLMLVGGVFWSYLIGTFCGVVAALSPDAIQFRATMDNLNSFMEINVLPSEMRHRLREYFHQTKHLRRAAAYQTLLNDMSPALQTEVAWTCNKRWLLKVWFLREAEEPLMVKLAMSLTAMVFVPGEDAPPGFLYIIHRGIALWAAKVITAGHVWGEDILFENPRLRLNYPAKAMNYLEVYLVDGVTLRDLIQAFPVTAKAIRKLMVRWAIRRAVVKLAQERLEARRGGGSVRGAAVDDAVDSPSGPMQTSSYSANQQQLQKNMMAANTNGWSASPPARGGSGMGTSSEGLGGSVIARTAPRVDLSEVVQLITTVRDELADLRALQIKSDEAVSSLQRDVSQLLSK